MTWQIAYDERSCWECVTGSVAATALNASLYYSQQKRLPKKGESAITNAIYHYDMVLDVYVFIYTPFSKQKQPFNVHKWQESWSIVGKWTMILHPTSTCINYKTGAHWLAGRILALVDAHFICVGKRTRIKVLSFEGPFLSQPLKFCDLFLLLCNMFF